MWGKNLEFLISIFPQKNTNFCSVFERDRNVTQLFPTADRKLVHSKRK